MRQNIKNNSIKKIDAKLYNANYYDFMLFKGHTIKFDKSYINNLNIADFSSLNIKDGILYSDVEWTNSINKGVKLSNIGSTGVDNGFISFRKDRISNMDFLDLYLNSELTLEADDKRLFMLPVTGNTMIYEYPMELIDNDERYISLKGGFYQGFFKLHGNDYQVLPHKLENDWVFHFEIRPRNDYELSDKIVNNVHPENNGIFFFMGTRAENKFWPYYKTSKELINNFRNEYIKTKEYFISGETNYFYEENEYDFNLNNNWVAEEVDDYFIVGDSYFSFDDQSLSKMFLKNKNTSIITCDDYFQDSYFDNKCPEIDNNKFVEDAYIGEDIEISTGEYEDSEGHKYNEWGINEIESDNKFLMFDRTSTGFTTNNWVEGTKVTLTRRQTWPNANYFLLMNRTKTGYTVSSIEKYNEDHSYDYNIYKDIRNNVFALRITKDGAIGYRYGVFTCENENKYQLIEEYSKSGVVNINQWNNINIRCTKISDKIMKLMFYVNGYLVFISKEIKAFDFKALDDVQEKQEGVPYNISIGGGSLGLIETILPNYYATPEFILPIERDFCGTFIGDIKSFKMYEGFIDYSSITNYLS